MFQLRFLIASPRKMSPHIFCHRDYRGQRTKPDDFHPQFNTYICQPKGTQTSYDVMLELMQSAAAHQSAQQLFSVVELFNPQTHERLKLKGDEIILRPSDLAAAQEAFDATQSVPIGNAEAPPVNAFHLGAILDALEANPDTQITLGGKELGTELPSDFVNKALSLQGAAHPTLTNKTIHVDVLTHEGRAIVLGVALKPVSLGKIVSDSPSLPVSAEGASESPAQPSIPPSVLDRVRAEILENGKATATTLSIALNIDAADIKTAVASEGSGLQNKGGWISLLS